MKEKKNRNNKRTWQKNCE